MSWAADGPDGNRLKLEKIEFIALCLENLAKNLLVVYSIFECSLNIFLLVFYKQFVYDKGTSANPATPLL